MPSTTATADHQLVHGSGRRGRRLVQPDVVGIDLAIGNAGEAVPGDIAVLADEQALFVDLPMIAMCASKR